MTTESEDITIDVSGLESTDITNYQIDMNSVALPTYSYTGGGTILGGGTTSWNTSSPGYGNITINTSGGMNGTWGSSSPLTAAIHSSTAGLKVTTDAEFDGDIKWQGRSLGEMLMKIESRLAILTPDSKKLEHFAALKKAYDHYKALEALCELPVEEDDNAN